LSSSGALSAIHVIDNQYVMRASGTFTHPNILGGFLLFSIFLNYYLLLKEQSNWKRFLANAVLLLQFAALGVTFSRSALFACGLSTLLFLFLQYVYARKNEDLLSKSRLKKIVLVLTIALAFVFCLFYPTLRDRGGILNRNEVVKHADEERVAYQEVALKIVKANPLLGVGFNHFKVGLKEQSPEISQKLTHQVHNIYALIASEEGVIGLVCFLLFLASLLRAALKNLSPFSMTVLSLFIGLLFIGFCDFYLIHHVQGKVIFFTTAALLKASSCERQECQRHTLAPHI
jgi:O-antigen ligase